MKCPICQNNLHKINIIVSTCTNDKCKLWGSSIPNLVLEALTQAKQDLERTRKALELAMTGLKNCKTRDHIGAVCRTPEYVDKILEQINTITKGGGDE